MLNKSQLALLPLLALSAYLVIAAVPKGIASLYQIGVENKLDYFYTHFEQWDDEKKQSALSEIKVLTDELVRWDPSNADNLALVAYQKYNAAFFKDETAKAQFLAESAALNQAAIEARPLHSESYALQAYVFDAQQQPAEQVLNMLSHAERVGPYEAYTATVALDLLPKYWQQIAIDRRLTLVNYLKQAGQYGLHGANLEQTIAQSPQRDALCVLLNMMKKPLRVCR